MPSLLRRPALLPLAALLLAGCEPAFHPTEVPGTNARMSAQARRYLDSALSLMQRHSLARNDIDWVVFRNETFMRANGAEVPAQTYPAIAAALQKLNKHSFFIPPGGGDGGGGQPGLWPPLAARQLEGGRVGYVRTATYGGSNPDGHAQDYHDLIRDADTDSTCGWVVDLRSNPGGNMWPMLAGVGPILGEGSPGSFIDADGVRTPWYYAGGVAGVEQDGQRRAAARARTPYRLRRQAPPVAVLTGINTASAAEAVAIAFRGRPGTRSFGLVTRGLPTANSSYDMPDGAVVVLTTAWEADRNGVIYEDRIEPDQVVLGDNPDNATLQIAVAWLRAHPACQAG